MPSVGVSWSGKNTSRASRKRLVEHLEPFAKASQALFSEPPPILEFDGRASGTALLLLPASVREALADSSQLREDLGKRLRAIGGALIPVPRYAPRNPVDQILGALQGEPSEESPEEAISPEMPPEPCLASDELDDEPSEEKSSIWIVRLPDVNLHGIQWRVFDPREIYTGNDHAGFVHLLLPEIPLLDGLVIEVQQEACWEALSRPFLGTADFYLASPSIHLRYYLESWFDRFLSWVKFFHTPSLQYSRYEPLSGWDAFEREVRYRQRYGKAPIDEVELGMASELLDAFRAEARNWEDYCDAGPSKPVFLIEQDLLGVIARHENDTKTAPAGERAESLGLLADRILDRAGYLEDWRGRAEEYFACLDEAGEALAELLALRRSERDLLRLARHRFEVATHVRDSRTATSEVREEDEDSDSTRRDAALLEGMDALEAVAASERPVALEARYLRRRANLQAGAENISGAIEDLERAVALWPRTNRDSLTAADFSEITDAHLDLARLLRIADRPEDAVDRLAAGLSSVRSLRQGKAHASDSEASGYVWLAAVEQELGRTDAQRHSLASAVDAHRELSRGVARNAGAWLPLVAEMLRQLARLEGSAGNEEEALRRLSEALQAGNDPDAMVTCLEIARIESRRHRFIEAFEAAVDSLRLATERRSRDEDEDALSGVITQIRSVLEESLDRLASAPEAAAHRQHTIAFADDACRSLPLEGKHSERAVRFFWLETATAKDWPFDEESFTKLLALFPDPEIGGQHLWFFRPAWEAEAVDSDWERFRFLYAGLSADHRESADAVLGGFPDFRRGLAGLAKPS